ATPETAPPPLQTMKQRHARRVDKLQAGDIELQGPLLGEHGFACHTQLLYGLVRQTTFDTKGLDAFARRYPRDSNHLAGHARQPPWRRRRRAVLQQEALVTRLLGFERPIARAPRRPRDISRIYDSSAALRRMPSFCIRLRRVLGCMLSIRAAPFGPSTRQP